MITSNGGYTISDIYDKYPYCLIFNWPFYLWISPSLFWYHFTFLLLAQICIVCWLINRYGVAPSAANFFFQSKPAAGYYCIYAKRPNETGWGVPDCASILSTPTCLAIPLSPFLSSHLLLLYSSSYSSFASHSLPFLCLLPRFLIPPPVFHNSVSIWSYLFLKICLDIPATTARHAKELVTAGIDFVTMDGTSIKTTTKDGWTKDEKKRA